jgi:probable LLM family oxidoreductase
VEIGVYTFADVPPEDGVLAAAEGRRLRELLEEIALADRVGLDVFGVGEHHRPEYAVSSPATVLAAAAARTERIRLTSAVTVLSSDDPVRVLQQFATVDQISGGRAEIMAGRGSFVESYPLFGHDLDDYDDLFAEKLDLLLALRASERVTWTGRHRPAIEDRAVYPRPAQGTLPVWIAVGGTPASLVRAGRLGLPIALAIIGGQPARFRPLLDLYREAAARAGHDPATLPVGINSHGYVGDTSAGAADAFWPGFERGMNHIGRERGWAPISRRDYETSRGPLGALLVGDPDEVAAKILAEHRVFANTRFLVQMDVGGMDHARRMRAIELLGTEVAPRVRAGLERRAADVAAGAGG